MGNIISYLEKYGDKSFSEMPFNEVDALVLSQFSYLKFDGVIPRLTDNQNAVSMAQMLANMDDALVFADERYEKNNRLLWEGMIGGKRFATMCCNYYANIINEDVETQFCAMVCYPQDSEPVLVYRGTDENLVGWKEDFNMAFKKPVPGQKLSVLYMNQAGLRLPASFIVCGHSKGGNLAVYSSMNTPENIQRRIKIIYSFDGPGFRPEILDSNHYEKIASRIRKYIPHSSLVGMILENHEEYVVVDSSSIGLFQHNPYTWKIEGCNFLMKPEILKSQRFMNEALNEWILKLEDEQLEVFVSTLFYVLEGCNVKNLIDLTGDWRASIHGMVKASREINEETKEKIHEILFLLADVLKDNFKNL